MKHAADNRFVYHYHAEYCLPGNVTSIDGIALMRAPVLSMNDYCDLKSLIAHKLVPQVPADKFPADKLIIRSLTPLGEVQCDTGVERLSG